MKWLQLDVLGVLGVGGWASLFGAAKEIVMPAPNPQSQTKNSRSALVSARSEGTNPWARLQSSGLVSKRKTPNRVDDRRLLRGSSVQTRNVYCTTSIFDRLRRRRAASEAFLRRLTEGFM